jgi:single-strand DNA-binding protein
MNMANVNVVILVGNITRDPDLKYLPSGSPVCELGLAVNRKWTNADGQAKEEVTFVDCTAFGKPAEVLAKYVKKGDPLYVQGRLKLDQWEAQDGSKRSKLRVVIDNFQFLKAGNGGQRDDGEQQQPRQQYGRPQQRQPQPAASDYDQGENADDAPQDDGSDVPF